MKKYLIASLFFSLTSCASLSPVNKPFVIRDYQEATLTNGLKVLLVKDNSLPYISATLMIHSGSVSDPSPHFGLTSFVSGMLDRGTKKYSTMEIADAFGRLGTNLSIATDREYTFITSNTLSDHQVTLFDLLGEVISQATFPQKEIKRYKSEVLAALKTMADKPSSYTQRMYDAYLYGDHPYGRLTVGSIKSVEMITRPQILNHYSKVFRPNNATLAVVGDFKENIISLLEDSFKDWKEQSIEPIAFTPKPVMKKRLVRLVTKEDLKQAEIRIGHIGIKRDNPDFLKLRVANTILGRGFVSRLMDHIRDNLGLTYSISSDFDARLDYGPFTIATFTNNQTVAKTIEETLTLLETFHKEGVTKEEVSVAKKYLLGVFPQAIDTPEKLAFNLLLLRLYSIPDSYLETYSSKISKITVKDVNQVIKKYIDPYNLKILVYAPSKVYAQVQFVGEIEVHPHTNFK